MGLDVNDSSRFADAPAPPGPPAAWDVRRLGLMALVGMTSLAVGATTSYWLVPVYLLAMGFLLGGPKAEPAPPAPVEAAAPVPEPAVEPPPIEPAPGPPAKPKGRGRPRGSRNRPKAKAEPVAAPPPMVASWVQVAPGKFVRVESPASRPEDDPAEAPDASPAPSEETPVPIEAPPEVVGSTAQDETAPPAPEEFVEALAPEPEFAPEGTPLGEPVAIAPEPEFAAEGEPVSVEPVAVDAPAPGPEPVPVPVLALPAPAPASVPTPVAIDEEDDEPPFAERLAAFDDAPVEEPSLATARLDRTILPPRRLDPGILRSARQRRDPRPRPRRPSGRIGARPRVVLHRG